MPIVILPQFFSFKMKALRKLGKMPTDENRASYKARVVWFLKLESILNEILTLGLEDLDLGYLAFNSDSIKVILNLFPEEKLYELCECPASRERKYIAIIEKVKRFRQESQTLALHSHFEDEKESPGKVKVDQIIPQESAF